MNILKLVQNETGKTFRRKGTKGKEFAGPCPFCRAGEDRFLLWPAQGRYWCRVCDRKGDAIQFVRDYRRLDFAEAKEYVECNHGDGIIHNSNNNDNNHIRHNSDNNYASPPTPDWQVAAYNFVLDCAYRLMGSSEGDRARAWLHQRTLADKTLNTYRIGYNPADLYAERGAWGLPCVLDDKGYNKKLWLPRGIVIPWWIDGDLWGVRIRRPVGDPKYYWLPGGTPALYNAEALTANQPVLLVEGEIDALTVAQSAGDVVTPVATGSTHGARKTRWVARLAIASVVLVAFDMDEAGEKAAQYWLDTLPNAKRWRPYWSDINSLAQDGVDVSRWVLAGMAGDK